MSEWPTPLAWSAVPRRARKSWLADRDGWQCAYCRQALTQATATLDHVIPTARGGLDDPSNLVLACQPCNHAKADKI